MPKVKGLAPCIVCGAMTYEAAAGPTKTRCRKHKQRGELGSK